MKNYTIFHCHTDLSNAFTTMDSVTKFKDYMLKAKECGMSAIAISEHGNVLEHVHKKEFAESLGLKYIHASEVYITETLSEKIRDNYHCVLIAKNHKGVLELNTLLSHKVACNREDGHVYYQPRILFDELINTSENIIITTACLGGILAKENNLKDRFIEFLEKNADRCFLEIQHHMDEQQRVYNDYLYELHLKTRIRLITGTDTHALNESHARGRVVLQRAKNIFFENEEGWDITFKTYDELIECYERQNVIPMDYVLEAIENTNVMANMIGGYELDRSYKYPKLYNNSEKVFKEKIMQGIKNRKLDKRYPNKEYSDRLTYEFNTMKTQGNIDYFLLEDDVKSYARESGIGYGYSRGSCSGSLICYLLNITDIDSIKYDMSFERFLSPMRLSLADVDTDYPPSKRELIKDYLYSKHGLYCAEIVTFNTIAMKGAIKDVCRAFNIPIEEASIISNNIEEKEEEYRKKYPQIFEYVDLLIGVIVSVGTHPSATIVSPHPLEDTIGTFTTSTSKFPISQINMKEIDSLNYVKLDLLGLDNIEVINEVCKLAGIERLTPDNMDFQDWNVYEEIKRSGLGVFQWESNSAHRYYKQLFNERTIERIKSVNPNLQYIDLLSIGNGAIRPAGNSYREALATGNYHDNGHQALNDLLAPTLGYLVYQEQIIQFLNKFCGYSLAEADLVRRGFAKKTGTEQFIPKIKEGFIYTMVNEYGTSVEEAENIIEQFLVVIIDASAYLFSKNHSDPYSMIGFACAYLRLYHPLEFFTVLININKDDQEKISNIMEYINQYTEIKVFSPKFRNSIDDCNMNKDTNSIYKGLSSIKHLNGNVANELYELRSNSYTTFLDLFKDIKEKTSCNSKQLTILIELDYFSEFSDPATLLKIIELCEYLGKKQLSIAKLDSVPFDLDLIYKHSAKQTEKTISQIDFESLIRDSISLLEVEPLSISQRVQSSLAYLGYIDMHFDCDARYGYVSEIESTKTLRITLYSFGNNRMTTFRIDKTIIGDLKVGDIIYLHKVTRKPKWMLDGEKPNGKPNFKMHPTDTEYHIINYERKSEYEFRSNPNPNANN